MVLDTRGPATTLEGSEGHIVTVAGPVPTSHVGMTHLHEHLLLDATNRPQAVPSGRADVITDTGHRTDAVAPEFYYEARRRPGLFEHALQLNDVDDAIAAATEFRTYGGDCVVDVTSIGLGRDPDGLRSVALATGLKIVMGTGHYTHPFHSAKVEAAGEEELYEELLSEVRAGTGTHGVRPGIIGEIGLSWPLVDCERRCLLAAVRLQQTTGLPLTIHPGRDREAPFEAANIVAEAGGDLTRTVMGHLDRTLFSIEEFSALAKMGCVLELDLFGLENWYYELAHIDMPSDAQRIDIIIGLRNRGYLPQVVVGQDIDNKTRLRKYGGEGYQHILRDVVPVMRQKGLSDSDIDMLLIANPRRLLTVTPDAASKTTGGL